MMTFPYSFHPKYTYTILPLFNISSIYTPFEASAVPPGAGMGSSPISEPLQGARWPRPTIADPSAVSRRACTMDVR